MHSKVSPVIGVIQKKQLVFITVIHCTNFKELMFHSSEKQNATNQPQRSKQTKKTNHQAPAFPAKLHLISPCKASR